MIAANGEGLVFLASTVCGGADWLGEVLNGHTLVLCPADPCVLLPVVRPEWQQAAGTGAYDGSAAPHASSHSAPQELQDRAIAAYAVTAYNELLTSAGKSVFVDQRQRNYHILDELRRVLPEAKWVWLKRSPLDVIAACKETLGIGVAELTGEALSPHSFDVGVALSRFAAEFSELSPNVCVVRYEDLVKDPAQELERICQFLGVESEPALRAPIGSPDPGSVGRWRELLVAAAVRQVLERFGSKLFEDLGYADDLKAALKFAGMRKGSIAATGKLPELLEQWSHYTEPQADSGVSPATKYTLLGQRYQAAVKIAEERLQLMNELERRATDLQRQLDASKREVAALQRLADDRLTVIEQLQAGAPIGEGARGSSLEESLDRARLDISFEARLRVAEDARKLAEALAEARYRIIQQQDRDIWLHRMVHPRELMRALAFPRLGVLYQYMPRPMAIPDRYRETPTPDPAPTVSIVTPSLNQGPYLEKTIQSVLDQGYPALEYIVQDGGSRDSTPDVLKRYAHALAHVESRQDTGQSNAINLGVAHATGEIMAYLNSDDILLPGAVNYVAAYFARHPEVDVVYGHRIVIDDVGNEIGRWVLPPHEDNVLKWADFIPQETLFWRRRLWEKVGGTIDESFRFAMDWDLVLRFWSAEARFARLPRFLGAFRYHPDQKTSAFMEGVGEGEMSRLRQRCHGHPVTNAQISLAVLPYLLKHVACHYLYRLRLFRY